MDLQATHSERNPWENASRGRGKQGKGEWRCHGSHTNHAPACSACSADPEIVNCSTTLNRVLQLARPLVEILKLDSNDNNSNTRGILDSSLNSA